MATWRTVSNRILINKTASCKMIIGKMVVLFRRYKGERGTEILVIVMGRDRCLNRPSRFCNTKIQRLYEKVQNRIKLMESRILYQMDQITGTRYFKLLLNIKVNRRFPIYRLVIGFFFKISELLKYIAYISNGNNNTDNAIIAIFKNSYFLPVYELKTYYDCTFGW